MTHRRMFHSSRTFALRGFAPLAVGLILLGAAGPAEAAPACADEATCAVKKPLVLFLLDYSTSMNSALAGDQSRWEGVVSGIVDTLDADDGLLASQVQVGLMRFGHDPDPDVIGTAIAGDASGLLDGQHLDVGFYDPLAPDKAYFECNGDALKDALLAAGSPLGGQLEGIESWTRGGLARARNYLQQTAADHPLDLGARDVAIVLVTDGPWTDQSGATELAPPSANPALVAAELFEDMSVRTYVVALGEAADQPYADAIGVAGGTGPARLGVEPQGLTISIHSALHDFTTNVRLPRCSPTMARVMVLLDASSSMLNVNGGTIAGGPGESAWDQAREALAGFDSVFDRPALGSTREQFTHFGLAVFGHDQPAPGEQKLLVDYGPCHEDPFAWALDPETSCEPPGCTDPWAGPPLTWTFKTGDQADPPFAEPVVSHMPRCDLHPDNPQACTGSGSHLHLGLQLVQDNLAAHKAECLAAGAAFPCTADTPFVNVLIVDFLHNSSDAAVQASLEAMHAGGVITRVIGFGPQVGAPNFTAQLETMASWGSGGNLPPLQAMNQNQLELALAAIADALPADPCCDIRVCTPPFLCGDGIVDADEQCDDGNTVSGDGCTVSCFLEPPGDTTDGDTTTGDESTSGSDSGTSSSTGTTSSTTDALTGTSTTGTTTTSSTSTTSTSPATTEPVPTSDGPPTTQGPSDTSDTTASSTSDPAGTGGPNSGDGCACTSSDPREGASAGLLLALAGLASRRRRR